MRFVLEVSTEPGRAGPILKIAGRAERFYNLLEIRAGFLQSFTRTNFLKTLIVLTYSQNNLKIS